MRDPFVVFWSVVALIALSTLGWLYSQTRQESAPTVAGVPPSQTEEEAAREGIAIPSWLRQGAGGDSRAQAEGGKPAQISRAQTLPDRLYATMRTTKGVIVLELFAKETPKTVANFARLSQEGFYNGVRFHRVIPGFMAQTGDPLTKDPAMKDRWGTGGPGYTIPDEFVPGLSNARGTVAMANTGAPDTGGSQFFINVTDNTFLDFDKDPQTSRHPVFGRVIAGMDVVDAIVNAPRDEQDRPLEDIVVQSINISVEPPRITPSSQS
ncbi:MAG: hypothetical protein KatS3mg100_700 [Candidatus Parcubacteria bacterium]|nr:MAG: hypothetical protein KatS3mg100_700 [Candidatus Parcubacteria bacterium]